MSVGERPAGEAAAIRVRAGVDADAAAIVAFNRAMARETEDKDLPEAVVAPGVRAVLDEPARGFYLVAECDSRVVGCLMVTYEWSDWRNGMFWWIQSVYVKPEFRRHGIYRRLYEHVRERARAAGGVCGFRLYVDKSNHRARQAYASLGMSETAYLMYEEELSS